MFTFAAVATLATQLVLVAADRVPHFDMAPICRRAPSLDPTQQGDAFQSCMNDEQGARTELAAQWLTFPAADRSSCTAETQAGGPPSYVELLVCLQDAKAARSLPAGSKL